jgi:hypothetical protein
MWMMTWQALSARPYLEEKYFFKDVLEDKGSINNTGSIAWKVALALLFQRGVVLACMWNGTKTIG